MFKGTRVVALPIARIDARVATRLDAAIDAYFVVRPCKDNLSMMLVVMMMATAIVTTSSTLEGDIVRCRFHPASSRFQTNRGKRWRLHD